MKNDEKYVSELSKTIRMLDDTVSRAQREEMRLITTQAVEGMSRSLMQVAKTIESVTRPFVINNAVQYQLSQMARLSLPSYISTKALADVAQAQLEAFATVETFAYSDMLNVMKSSLLSVDWSSYCNVLSRTLQKPLIDAPDFCYLRLSELALQTAREISLPRGMATALDKLNVASSYRLAKCEDISYEVCSRSFINEREPDNKANPVEMNVICSAAGLLQEYGDEIVSETELINFMNVLQDKPGFASEDGTAKKIMTIVKQIAEQIDFDAHMYYHARARNSEDCPYTFDQMLTAPSGVTGPGRYNHPGQAFYYFTNTKEGAVSEVMKHINDDGKKVVQIAAIAPKRCIRMIDLSGCLKSGLTFLRHIRFSAKDAVPKAYLIPCFVSDCCRAFGIEGIKYFGSKEYCNYVCWEDGYFSFVRMEQ